MRAQGAVQAQDYHGAKWALGQRSTGTTDASIEQEFDAGAILRTHVLRPTWHLVDPMDIRWMLRLTAPRVKQAMASYNRTFGLDARIFRRSQAVIEKALRDGRFLTRQELASILLRSRVPEAAGQRLAHLMMEAELDGVVCSGPRRGKQFTYALLEERVPPAAVLSRDESLRALAVRYFATRGPATLHDFAWWSGLTMADARRAIDIAGDAIDRADIDGRAHHTAGDASRPRKPTAHLLPNYDEYFIGHRDRGAIGVRVRSVESVTGGSMLITNVVIVDGQLVGGWRRRDARDGVALSLDLRARLTPAERSRIRKAIARLARFLAAPVTLHGA